MKLSILLAVGALGQQAGHQKANVHLKMSVDECSASGCVSKQQGVTLDTNWRWTHKAGTYTNCYTGTTWDPTLCPDPATCTKNCAIDGIPASDWTQVYGISTDGKSLDLKYVVDDAKTGEIANVGSRTYMMEGDDKYKMFKLKNREFTFDVDVSNLPCGLNGALYFVEMQEDGGLSEFPGNKAGAAFGTGYCDAQCPHDVKYISGEANSKNWTGGEGYYGSCCNEMDIWEANQAATAVTPHTCTKNGPYRGEGAETHGGTTGVCDTAGCDFNPYRVGDTTFFGPGSNFAVDSTKPMTVVTQFITSDGTDAGDLVEIKRIYVQGGKVIQPRNATLAGLTQYSSVTEGFCTDQKKLFGDQDDFTAKGGLKSMGETLERGMVLVMSLWDDTAVSMLWLDSAYPTDQPKTKPGVTRGPCGTDTGKPGEERKKYPKSDVKYSNIKYGTIGSTFAGGPTPAPGPAPVPPGTCTTCGHNCHGSCATCGQCSDKPACSTQAGCLGACNGGNNAMWCGGGSSPTPPPPAPVTPTPAPAPSACPGGSLSACIGLCPSAPPAAYKDCVDECVVRCK